MKWMMILLLLAACAWGQGRYIPADKMAEAEREFFEHDRSVLYPPGEYNTLEIRRYDIEAVDKLSSIIQRLDRIEARLDSLAYVSAKVPTLKWKVCLDSTWYVYDGPEGRVDSLVSHETWWLYVVKDTRKFRVCKLEEVAP